jgi:peptidyl-prolyl cis-trans isomerase C
MRIGYRWLREPMLHFLVAGLVLFIVGEIHRKQADPYRIVLTPQREAQLANRYALQFGGPPEAGVRAALVEQDLEDEILYRQGLALGLDKNDELVRRRIVQKMQFLLEDLNAPAEPTDEDLSAYYASHVDRYTAPARVTFSHIYFSSEGGAENARARAVRALDALMGDESGSEALNRRAAQIPSAERRAARSRDLSRPSIEILSRDEILSRPAIEGFRADIGDPFPDLSHFSAHDPAQVRRLFGETEISAAAFSAPLRRWVGPYRSSYGWHLIYVDRRSESARKAFAVVRDKVRTDFLLDAQARANRAAFSHLAREFTVVRAKS